jgi:hypothetical protein
MPEASPEYGHQTNAIAVMEVTKTCPLGHLSESFSGGIWRGISVALYGRSSLMHHMGAIRKPGGLWKRIQKRLRISTTSRRLASSNNMDAVPSKHPGDSLQMSKGRMPKRSLRSARYPRVRCNRAYQYIGVEKTDDRPSTPAATS